MMRACQIFIALYSFSAAIVICSSKKKGKISWGHKEEPFRYAIGSPKRYEPYDYASVTSKLVESFDDTCGVFTNIDDMGHNLTIRINRPSPDLQDYWTSIPPPLTMIDRDICLESPQFFDRTGCSKGVALHPDSPRCHREKTKEVCDALSQENPLPLNETIASRTISDSMLISTSPFIITAKGGGIVSRCGGVSLPCGNLQTRTGCGGIRHQIELDSLKDCHDIDSGGCNDIPRFGKVFVLSYMYDSAIGHFLIEVLPRVVYNLDLLQQQDVHIHYGCDKKYGRFSPPLQFMTWLGFSPDKFIQGNVWADEVMVPRDGACQDAMWNRWEIAKLRHYFLQKVGLQHRISWRASKSRNWGEGKPIIVVVQRSGSKFSANKGDVTRLWTDELFDAITMKLKEKFRDKTIVPYSDRNTTMMKCVSCQVELFSKTTVLVGMHGAGLSNMMFMPPESTVVEITAQNGHTSILYFHSVVIIFLIEFVL